jgi:DNA-binding response OmpR family regulator
VVRYSPSGKRVQIEAELDEMLLWVSITDQGPEIPIDEQKMIFGKSIHAVRGNKGRGQGLYICRKIIEAHGGKFKVVSPLDGIELGTRVSFSLPLTPEQKSYSEEKPQNQMEHLEAAGEGLRVLVVSDAPDFQELFHTILSNNGYLLESASGGLDAVDLVHDTRPDMIVMDWDLSGISGLSLCRNLRRWTDVPILVVTDQTNQRDLVAALDAGADDYIARPFDSKVLLARLNALARRRSQHMNDDRGPITIGDLTIDFESFEVWRSGEMLHLTPSEYNLLAALARHPGQVLTYDQLMNHIYDRGEVQNRHTLFVHVSRLRKKLESNPDEPALLRTKWGVGYVLDGR